MRWRCPVAGTGMHRPAAALTPRGPGHGANRARTGDLRAASATLSQLSYSPEATEYIEAGGALIPDKAAGAAVRGGGGRPPPAAQPAARAPPPCPPRPRLRGAGREPRSRP